MISFDMTFEDMKKEIKFRKYILNETINPIKNPSKFSGFDGLDYLSRENIKVENARCLSLRYISNTLGWLGSGNGFKDYLRELQYNAFMHGNKWNKNLDVKIKLGFGEKGLIFRIEDSGEGFNYEKLYEDFKNKKRYSKNKGSGFRKFNEGKNHVVSWEGKGNIANLMMKVINEDNYLWKEVLYLELNKKPVLL